MTWLRARRLPALDDHAAARAAGGGIPTPPGWRWMSCATSPPLAVTWAAALGVEALTRLGRLDEAKAIASVAAGRNPAKELDPGAAFPAGPRRAAGRAAPPGRGPGRYTHQRGLEQALGVTIPAVASWRTARGRRVPRPGPHDEAAALAAEQLALARKAGRPLTLGIALRVRGTWPRRSASSKPARPATAGPGPGRPPRQPAPLRPADAGQGAAAPRARSRRAHPRRARRRGEAGAARGPRPAPAGRPRWPGRADRGRAPGRRPSGRRRRAPRPADHQHLFITRPRSGPTCATPSAS